MCMLFPEQPTPSVPTPCVRAAEEKLTLEKGTALARLIATASPQEQPLVCRFALKNLSA